MENVYIDVVVVDTSNGSIDYTNDDADFHPTSIRLDSTLGSIVTNVTE